MDVPTISILPYALWPLLTLAMVALWIVAMAEITGHRRRGMFSRAGLLCMAAVVSVVAIVAVAGIGAVFAGQRFEAVSGAREDLPRHAYLFSFGLDHVSYATPGRPKSTKERGPLSPGRIIRRLPCPFAGDPARQRLFRVLDS